jgi:hypothetical protein
VHENDQSFGAQIAAMTVKVHARFVEGESLEAWLVARLHHDAVGLGASSVMATTNGIDEERVCWRVPGMCV